MDKKSLFITLLLISSLLIVDPPPMAKADGSVNAQDIWIKCDDDAYPEGFSSEDDGETSFENVIHGSIIVHSDLMGLESTWDFNVTRLNFYIQVNEATHLSTAAVYQFIASDNAGALYGETAEKSLSGTGWKYFYPDSPIEIPSGTAPKYWAVINADELTGLLQLRWDYNIGPGEGLSKAQTYGTYPNPMTGESVTTTYDYWIRGYVTAFTTNQTVFNQYYDVGNITEARRDINITFPSGISNREIKMSLPKNEKLLNITYSNEGGWNESLSASDYTLDKYYNETHMLITIPEATIASYGEDFRVFSETYDYVFTMKGLFLENGTFNGPVTVTAHYPSGSEERVVDGEIELGYDEKPIQFTWSLSGGGSRRIYTYEGSYDIYVFTPDDDYAAYSFYIKDYSGSVGSGDTYLESLRVVNGTERVVERVLIWDTVNAVPLTLTIGQIYILQARLYDGTIYRFGYFTPGSDPTPTLTISGIPFSDQAHYVGEHIAVEATRPNATHIQIAYENLLEDTTDLLVEICYMNGTQVWNDTTLNDDIIFNWYGADNETDYLVNFEAYSEFYGDISYSKALAGEKPDITEPPDLDAILGSGFRLMISIFIIYMGFIIFSAYTAELGVFSGIAITYVLNYIEFIPIPIPWYVLHALMGLLIMWALAGGNK